MSLRSPVSASPHARERRKGRRLTWWGGFLFLALFLGMAAGCASSPDKEDEEDHFLARLSKNAKRKGRALQEARKKKLEEFRKSGGRMAEDDEDEDGDEREDDEGTLDYYRDGEKKGQSRGEAIKVIWEGLARERELFEQSKEKRSSWKGPDADMKITLVSQGHPDATLGRKADNDQLESRASTAVVPDRELKTLVRQLEKDGFYRYARDTDGVSSNFGHSRARGRVTVERGGESVTLVSMRGQGLDPGTKAIPRLYSSAKRAILIMRNRRPTLNWQGVTREELMPSSKGLSDDDEEPDRVRIGRDRRYDVRERKSRSDEDDEPRRR